MKKIQIEIPEEVLDAITAEALRELRTPAQQASYLLLTWSREIAEKRQKSAKPGVNALKGSREELLAAQRLG